MPETKGSWNMVRRRALLSVWDKTGLIPLAKGLAGLGFELVASGGSAKALVEAGLPVTQVDDVTGHPEILGGRVKTLHPGVHGGILSRRTPEHLEEIARHGIRPIDVVVCNLYPFVKTVAAPGVTEAEAIEQIDIGGVTLLRAAAKNFESVVIACDPADYDQVLSGLAEGSLDEGARRRLALKAFQQTAAYDAAISGWLQDQVDGPTPLPAQLTLRASRAMTLRYGENSHQAGALYRFEGQPVAFEPIGGEKELSYNNLNDLEAAWAIPAEFDRPAVAIIKHANPSGVAVADDLVTAFQRAYDCDTVSAFGGIVATNRPVDAGFIEAMGKLFVEVIAAPAFTDEALALLAARKKNCRVLRFTGAVQPPAVAVREAHGGLLVQTADRAGADVASWRCVTTRAATEAELRDLAFAWIACKHVKSNAIVLVKGEATVGVGAGQMNRLDSTRIAAWRAGDRAQGAVLASDAFFPFADGLEAAIAVGATAVVQPGGSVRDDEVIAAAEAAGIAMYFTGRRHFRH
jgi:phosphoribosylaminoimidazolecarboxamide formyltransferase/IMP cyclohydrolase